MAESQILHVSFAFQGSPNLEALKKAFDLGLDWAHYVPNCWIVKTTSSAEKWYERLKPCMGPNDLLLISRIDLNESQGWLSKWVWDWIAKNR